jgi:hypothetical protein
VAVGFDQWFYTPADRGYLAESYPGYLPGTQGALPTAGRHEMVRLKLPQAALCTNIVMHVATAGSALTAGQCFCALYTAAGTLIAQSVDQATNWGGTGNKNAQLNGGPYYLPVGEYYATFWFNGTTGPTIPRSMNANSALVNGSAAAPNLFYAQNTAGLTTAAPSTLGAQTALGVPWWVALN